MHFLKAAHAAAFLEYTFGQNVLIPFYGQICTVWWILIEPWSNEAWFVYHYFKLDSILISKWSKNKCVIDQLKNPTSSCKWIQAWIRAGFKYDLTFNGLQNKINCSLIEPSMIQLVYFLSWFEVTFESRLLVQAQLGYIWTNPELSLSKAELELFGSFATPNLWFHGHHIPRTVNDQREIYDNNVSC